MTQTLDNCEGLDVKPVDKDDLNDFAKLYERPLSRSEQKLPKSQNPSGQPIRIHLSAGKPIRISQHEKLSTSLRI